MDVEKTFDNAVEGVKDLFTGKDESAAPSVEPLTGEPVDNTEETVATDETSADPAEETEVAPQVDETPAPQVPEDAPAVEETPAEAAPVVEAPAEVTPEAVEPSAEVAPVVTSSGCEHCDNTGLEPDMQGTQACTVCNGSPFGV